MCRGAVVVAKPAAGGGKVGTIAAEEEKGV
jgi:hypothetical protein